MSFEIPSIQLDSIRLDEKIIHVVRDDLLPGGTKQRGARGLLEEYRERGYRHFVYASPFCGYAQIALAYLCQQLGLECTIFSDWNRTTGETERVAHPYTFRAQALGATVTLCDSLAEAETCAAALAARLGTGAFKIPLGFDCPEFYRHYQNALRIEWRNLVYALGGNPDVLWLPVGSGTLTRSFLNVLQDTETRIHAVNVRVLPVTDSRIAGLADSPRVTLFHATLAFHDAEPTPPSFPSNVFYDAKLGKFIKSHGNSGDVWWNVAR